MRSGGADRRRYLLSRGRADALRISSFGVRRYPLEPVSRRSLRAGEIGVSPGDQGRGAGGRRAVRAHQSKSRVYFPFSSFPPLLILHARDRSVRFSEVSARSRCRISETTAGQDGSSASGKMQEHEQGPPLTVSLAILILLAGSCRRRLRQTRHSSAVSSRRPARTLPARLHPFCV